MKCQKAKIKNIVILDECSYTRSGLETLLKPEAQIFCSASLGQCQKNLLLLKKGDLDLVILSLRHHRCDDMTRLLILLRHCHPSCLVLLNPYVANESLLQFYLNCLHLYVGFIDLTLPITTLTRFIELSIRNLGTMPSGNMIAQTRLTKRECYVLQSIITGHQSYDIAKKLKLSIKTISSHKRAGLRKLGVSNIQELYSPLSLPLLALPNKYPPA